jgi:hypothetical protein
MFGLPQHQRRSRTAEAEHEFRNALRIKTDVAHRAGRLADRAALAGCGH